MKKVLRIIFKIIVFAFAIFGLGLTLVFIAQKTGLTKDRGAVDKNERFFKKFAEAGKAKNESEIKTQTDSVYYENKLFAETFYKLYFINNHYPKNAAGIINTYKKTNDIKFVRKMIDALSIYIPFDSIMNQTPQSSKPVYSENYAQKWMNSNEWEVLKEALVKEKNFVNKASQVAGVEPRLIICCVIGEQMRIYNQARERFKTFFAPVKSLSFMTNLSYGVAGVKEGTAVLTRNHLKDTASLFYLGKKFENMLDFEKDSQDVIGRLTNFEDHYYTYLYVALILKQIKTQWEKSGCDISDRPEILSTIYNLGFAASKPKPDPKPGGASFSVNGIEYSFGGVSFDFYYSGELFDEFPFWEDKWVYSEKDTIVVTSPVF